MPGPNSSFDRNDYQLLQQFLSELRKLNENLEDLNEALGETGEDGQLGGEEK
jgi:hypothetical protein